VLVAASNGSGGSMARRDGGACGCACVWQAPASGRAVGSMRTTEPSSAKTNVRSSPDFGGARLPHRKGFLIQS